MALLEHRRGAHLSYKSREPVGGIPLLSVTHGQCDARPMVTLPACAGTKLILLGDRGTCALPKVAPESGAAWMRTRDLLYVGRRVVVAQSLQSNGSRTEVVTTPLVSK